MARAPRNYAAEYARRVALEQSRARSEGREPSLSRARGHTSREHEALQRQVRRHMRERGPKLGPDGEIVRRGYQTGEAPKLRGFIARHGGDAHVREQLELSREITKAYESGDRDRARLLLMRRDPDFPEWFFWYHGIFG